MAKARSGISMQRIIVKILWAISIEENALNLTQKKVLLRGAEYRLSEDEGEYAFDAQAAYDSLADRTFIIGDAAYEIKDNDDTTIDVVERHVTLDNITYNVEYNGDGTYTLTDATEPDTQYIIQDDLAKVGKYLYEVDIAAGSINFTERMIDIAGKT